LTAKCFVASKISLHYITMLFDFRKGYLNVLVSLFRVLVRHFAIRSRRSRSFPLVFSWGLRDTRSTIRSPNKRLRIGVFLVRRFPDEHFDMLPPRSWFDRHRKMGKFTVMRA
jgi:hypothetical protein